MAERDEPILPRRPIDELLEPIDRFLHVESAAGLALLAATLVALLFANSPAAPAWLALWQTEVGFRLGPLEVVHSLQHWISEGLMAIFFFVVGLEVKRELVLGELREPRRAVLPLAAALGGMLVPAGVYLALQAGQPGARGWGIPMATDIAFVVGCMAVLGPRVPPILRVTLLSLAIADDIGAILVIAIGYSKDLNLGMLLLGFAGIAAVAWLARLGVRSFLVYAVLGVFTWSGFHASGIHATLAGVVLGLMTPATATLSETRFAEALGRASELFRGEQRVPPPQRAARMRAFRRQAREAISPLETLETALHPWSAFGVLVLFALANAGVRVQLSALADPIALAAAAGLTLGKPVGILLASGLAVRASLGRLPEGLTWGALCGGGLLAGIGFTMSLFIAGLALEGQALDSAKVGVLGGSVVSALLGMGVLVRVLPPVRS